MRVAVVTPYHKEPRAWLERCLASVRAQTHPCEHLVVADGHAQGWLDGAGVRHLKLDRAHGDYGNTPRSIGAQLAVAEGFDAVAFLDADNWVEADHVAQCVAVAERSGADVVTCGRRLVREDGSVIPFALHDDASGEHVDTSCLFLLFGAFHALPRWLLMPKPMAMLGDRYFVKSLRDEGLKEARAPGATVNYLCGWADVYRAVGEAPPAFAKDGIPVARLGQWLRRLSAEDFDEVYRLSGCRVGPGCQIAARHGA
jgi:glycosyltransferase involved in cell wall biosynthesis